MNEPPNSNDDIVADDRSEFEEELRELEQIDITRLSIAPLPYACILIVVVLMLGALVWCVW